MCFHFAEVLSNFQLSNWLATSAAACSIRLRLASCTSRPCIIATAFCGETKDYDLRAMAVQMSILSQECPLAQYATAIQVSSVLMAWPMIIVASGKCPDLLCRVTPAAWLM